MEGRWYLTCTATRDGEAPTWHVAGTHAKVGDSVAVVPCDAAAVGRGAEALVKIAARWGLGEWQVDGARELAEAVLRAAGETP